MKIQSWKILASLLPVALLLALPLAAATTPTQLSGTYALLSVSVISSVTTGQVTRITADFVAAFTGGISGTCSGTAVLTTNVGPSGTFGSAVGPCTLVGTVNGLAGSITINLSSPVGFETTANSFDFLLFSSATGSGTGALASVHIVNGVIGTGSSLPYTAFLLG
jgi:hypothetical protein